MILTEVNTHTAGTAQPAIRAYCCVEHPFTTDTYAVLRATELASCKCGQRQYQRWSKTTPKISAHLRDARQVNHGEVEHEGRVDTEVDALGRYSLVASRQPVRFSDDLLPDLGKIEKLLAGKVKKLPIIGRGDEGNNERPR